VLLPPPPRHATGTTRCRAGGPRPIPPPPPPPGPPPLAHAPQVKHAIQVRVAPAVAAPHLTEVGRLVVQRQLHNLELLRPRSRGQGGGCVWGGVGRRRLGVGARQGGRSALVHPPPPIRLLQTPWSASQTP